MCSNTINLANNQTPPWQTDPREPTQVLDASPIVAATWTH